MIKKKVLENLAVSFLFFLIVAVFRFKFPIWLSLFFLGGVVGTFILELDFLVYLFLYPSESIFLQPVSLAVLINRASEIRKRVFHTYIFQVVFLVVSFYVLTSTASAFGSGVVFFAFLHLLKDQFEELSKNSALSPLWKGFFEADVPGKFQRLWVGAGTVFLFYLLFLLTR